MLKPARVANTETASRLIKLWAVRYLPDLSVLPSEKGEFPVEELVELASTEQRAKTVQKIQRILRISCERAGVEANSLFSYIPNIVNLAESRLLIEYVEQVYEKTFEIYQQQPPPKYFLRFIAASSNLFSKLALSSLMLPMITQFAEELEPVLLQLQQQHSSTANPRTIGFITTQFHFSTHTLQKQLTDCEQVLVLPYLKFVEEQVCIPWQRICQAAAAYPSDTPVLTTIEHLLPECHAIAQTVYQQAKTLYPYHRSRRGSLDDAGVMTSTLRDLNMVQGYLWLCVLEGNMNAIEHELLPLCVAVFPSIDVQWELVERMVQLLIREIQARANSEHLYHLRPFTQALQEMVAAANPHRRSVTKTLFRR